MTPIDVATNTAQDPIGVGTSPSAIAITPDGATAYIANIGSDDVTPIEVATNTPGTPITVGDGPHAIAITPTIAGTPNRDTVAFGDQDVAGGQSAPETVTSRVRAPETSPPARPASSAAPRRASSPSPPTAASGPSFNPGKRAR